MIKKYSKFLQKINEEVGIKRLKSTVEGFTECEIWFHQDNDGVFSALGMKYFLETYYKIKTVDAHIIQYGGIEFAIEKVKPGRLPILVDFAHAKPGVHYISLDHHSSTSGSTDFKSGGGYFKPAKSNVETISGEISYSDIFTNTDILSARTVDSADFLRYNLTPDDIQNSIFKIQPNTSAEKNRFLLGFIVNRLSLALKNKRITIRSLDGKRTHTNKNLLECLVLDSNPSIYSLYTNLMHYINSAESTEYNRSSRKYDLIKSLPTPEEISANLAKYTQTRVGKAARGLDYDDKYKIVSQIGIGNVASAGTGAYDRYVVFKNYPEAEFVATIFGEQSIDKVPAIGLLQVSCNPFVEKRLKGIDLGKIATEAITKYKGKLEKIRIPLTSIKLINESEIKKTRRKSSDAYEPIGFTWNDLSGFYKDCVYYIPDRKKVKGKALSNQAVKLDFTDESNKTLQLVKNCMDKEISEWTEEEFDELSWIRIPIWDIIIINSGGHHSITNLMGFNYLWGRKDLLQILFETEDYVKVMKYVRSTFLNILREKIDHYNKHGEIIYADDVKLGGTIANENINNFYENRK